MLNQVWRGPKAVAVAVILVGACNNNGGGGDPKLSTHAAAVNAEQAISRTGKALAFTLSSDGTLGKTASAGSASGDAVVAPMMPAGMSNAMSTIPSVPPAMLKAMVGPTLAAEVTATPMPSMMTAEEKFDQAASEVRRLMEERLFVDSNLESDDGSTATYLLKPDPTCRPLPADSDPPGTLPPIGTKCEMDFTKVEVRIAVTNDGDGVRMRFLVGAARLELVVFIVHSDLLAAEVDLPKTKAAVDTINMQLGTDGSPTGTYDRLTGKFQLALKVGGPAQVTGSISILEPFDVAQTNGAEFITARAEPLFSITGDGVSKTATLQLGLGATEIATTWDPMATGVGNRDQRISLGGIYGKISLDETAKKLVLSDVGLGEAKLTVRGTPILDLNLNPDSMRRFSGAITVNADDTAHLELQPKFDLSLAFDYNAVAAELNEAPPSTVGHDTYGVKLLNGGAAASIDTVKSSGTFAGGLRVGAGTLTLSAASAPTEMVTVPAGMCLTSVAGGAPAGTNPLLGSLAVTTCP